MVQTHLKSFGAKTERIKVDDNLEKKNKADLFKK